MKTQSPRAAILEAPPFPGADGVTAISGAVGPWGRGKAAAGNSAAVLGSYPRCVLFPLGPLPPVVETPVSTICPSIVCLVEYLLQKVKFLETFEIIGGERPSA